MRTLTKLTVSTVLALVAGCSLLFEPVEEVGETGPECPEHVTRVEQLARAEQPGPGGLTVATYSLPPSCGPWLVALSAQISSTSVEDCTRISPCGLATLLVDGETRSMVGAGPLREGAASWVDTVVVGASSSPTELTIDLLGGARGEVVTELAQLELVAIPLPAGTTLDSAYSDELEVEGTDWLRVTRLDGERRESPQLVVAAACSTQAPGFGAVAFQLLVQDSDPWPLGNGPRNSKDPVRCAPLFGELTDDSRVLIEAQGEPINPGVNSIGTALLGRIQRVDSPPGTSLRQQQLSSELLLDESVPLVTGQLGEGSFLIVATGALAPFDWVQDVSEPTLEMQLELASETVQSYESSIASQAHRLTQGFARRVQGPTTLTLSATVREFQSPDTRVYAAWSSLLVIPAP